MNLVRLSQDMDIANPENISYFLVFQHEDGEEERVPVPESTAHSLLSKVMKKQAVKGPPNLEKLAEPEIPEGASVFGDDDDEYTPREEEEEAGFGEMESPLSEDDGRFEVERSL